VFSIFFSLNAYRWIGCFCHLRKLISSKRAYDYRLPVQSHLSIPHTNPTTCFCGSPLLSSSSLFATVAAAQIRGRLGLTWYGLPAAANNHSVEGATAGDESSAGFRILVAAIAAYFTTYVGFFFLLVYLDPNTYTPDNAPIQQVGTLYVCVLCFRNVLHYGYWIVATVVLTNVRRYVRSKYAIPSYYSAFIASEYDGLGVPKLSDGGGGGGRSSSCDFWEDFCFSCWCPCLSSSQLLRHTAEYDVYPAACCTGTGILTRVNVTL